MDWRAINFDWNRARAFLVTAEEGSLSAAARALNTTQPTLGRQVAALEAELGVVLFERHGRGLSLTPTGLKLVEYVKAMSEAANQLSLAASGQSESIEGNVVISAAESMAAFGLPAILKSLRTTHPGITLEVIATNQTSDLKRREADIAIRGFRPLQPDLISKRISDVEVGFYATPDYLQSLTHPIHFGTATFLGFDQSDEMINMLNARGLAVTRANFPVVCEHHLVQWEMVKNGFGIGVMPIEVGDNEPNVVKVLQEIEPFIAERWLVAHRELRSSRRIRVVFDHLADALRAPD
ncbi:LysR family transcriptional regulator [Pontibacterium granulatum]|uniref:LysR family transcriptional regulator n=1 Tax=Pontibacterium granulatum TaxID=2036029 RepID=UPI00249C065E|nr:LysR family transcriptional regulator [Pontibacterium granulatum]MDI3323945.1 LysR family transcriptional regulator [Pontibacterium granulatum]